MTEEQQLSSQRHLTHDFNSVNSLVVRGRGSHIDDKGEKGDIVGNVAVLSPAVASKNGWVVLNHPGALTIGRNGCGLLPDFLITIG